MKAATAARAKAGIITTEQQMSINAIVDSFPENFLRDLRLGITQSAKEGDISTRGLYFFLEDIVGVFGNTTK